MLPRRVGEVQSLFVTRAADVAVGGSLLYQTPDGRTVNITRRLAAPRPPTSSPCRAPARIWAARCIGNRRTLVISARVTTGRSTPRARRRAALPGEAGLSLPRYGLRVDRGLLYIDVPVEHLSVPAQAGSWRWLSPNGPGHDPCLTCLKRRAPAGEREAGA